MVVMLGWTLIRFRNDLKYRRSRGLFPFLAGMYASFFFLNSFLDLLVFPYPGVMSRDFFLPIYRMTMIFLVPLTVKKWFSWQPVHRMLLLVCTGAAMFIGPVPVLLEFLRLEGAGVISVFFLIGVALFGVEIPRILPNLVAPIQKFLRLGMGVLRHRWAVLVRR
ncbi:hypothetical protein [Spirochaeta lutea]|nr:hypothetical protein [Spirochaeta lutea]